MRSQSADLRVRIMKRSIQFSATAVLLNVPGAGVWEHASLYDR